MSTQQFTKDDLLLWSPYSDEYFLEILNGEYSLKDARSDLASLIPMGHEDK